jgi:small subunit ribosomal protein S16
MRAVFYIGLFGGFMAVHIRLQRRGAIHKPFYHVVAADHKSSRDGKFIEKLGHYDPHPEASLVEFKAERMQYWFSKGAQISGAVEKLMKIKNLKLTREINPKAQ